METNEIMTNEEVIETAGEIVEATSKKGLNKAASLGLGVVIGAVAAKYVLMPAGAKVKNWYEERKAKKHGYVNADYREAENVEPEDETEDEY